MEYLAQMLKQEEVGAVIGAIGNEKGEFFIQCMMESTLADAWDVV